MTAMWGDMMCNRDFYPVWMDALKRDEAVFMPNWNLLSTWGKPENIPDDVVLPTSAELENIGNAAYALTTSAIRYNKLRKLKRA